MRHAIFRPAGRDRPNCVFEVQLAALRRDATVGKVLTLSGPKAFTISEVIALCEKLGTQEAKVTRVPVSLLKATRAVTVFFQWFGDAADRLAMARADTARASVAAIRALGGGWVT